MSKNINTNRENKRRPISSLISFVLILATIASVLLFSVGCKKNNNKTPEFDYMTADLSQYIEFTTPDYKKFKVEIDIAEPREIDVEVAILNMLCADKDKTPLYGGGDASKIAEISAGDVVKIWYRGYLIGDDGKEIAVPGMCNFGGASAYTLEIGSNSFIPGFELNLIGHKPSDYSKFEKITSGTLDESKIAYVTYTKTTNDDSSTKVTESNVRLDLSEDLDAIYGLGFKAKILNLKFGDKVEFVGAVGDKKYNYKDVTLNFFTECETNPIVIDAYFPYDYQKEDLRNEDAKFEVYVEKLEAYTAPEFTDTYLKEKIEDGEINVTLEELNACKGVYLIDKYRDFAMKTMMEIYKEEYDALVESEAWLYFDEISKAKQYPTDKVQEIYDDYIREMEYQFSTSGGQIYNQVLGQYKTYTSFDAYATVYVNAKTGENWKDVVYAQAQSYIKERMTMFYILKAEGLAPSDADFKKEYDKVRQEYLDEYVAQYLQYIGKSKDDYTEQEYQQLVEDCKKDLYANFDEEYFTIRTYYTILAKTIITWPEVSTLDDRRSYPQDK